MFQHIVHHVRDVTVAGAGGVASREMNAHFLLFSEPGTSAHGVVSPKCSVDLSSSVKLFWKHTSRHTWRCSFVVTVNTATTISTSSSALFFLPFQSMACSSSQQSQCRLPVCFAQTHPWPPSRLANRRIFIFMDEYVLNCPPVSIAQRQRAARR